MIMLMFIYYFKNILSINDIEKLMTPLSDNYFHSKGNISLEDVYTEVIGLSMDQVAPLQSFVQEKYSISEKISEDAASRGASEKDCEFLQIFAFICALAFDVYVKRLMIEKLIDFFPEPEPKKK